MTVNTLDLIILIPLLLWAWQGYKKGLIISVASLAALVLGLYFAFTFSDYTAGQLNKHFEISPQYMAIVSFIVTFIVVVVAVVLVGRILHKFVDVLMLGFLNKAAGLVFGVLKGALYLSILIFLINYFDPGEHLIKKEYKKDSMLYAPVASVAPLLYSRLNLDNLDLHLPTKEDILKEVY